MIGPLMTGGGLRRVYLIGICGTAMASLAGMLRERGVHVAGSDANVYPPMSDFLSNLGIQVHHGFAAEHIASEQPDLVVIGNALSRGNPEIECVLNSGNRYASMAEAVQELFIRGKRSIVVAGTHGKTTTTAMLAWILYNAGRDPSFLVGGIAENFGTSFRLGSGTDFVIEGDEYDTAFFDKAAKFLHYLPRIVLLKNIEYDHADIYADLDSVKLAFRRLINIVPSEGLVVAGADSPAVREIAAGAHSRVEYAGLNQGDWRAVNLRSDTDGTTFEVTGRGEPTGTFHIPLLGAFNVDNALGVIVTARAMGLSEEEIAGGLRTFKSVKRRLELRGEVGGIAVYDDFAHHPTAVRETLRAVRERFPQSRIWGIFEPRSQSSRRAVFEPEYIEAFGFADITVVARPYGKLNLPPEEILSPDRVVDKLRGLGRVAQTFDSTDAIVDFVGRQAVPGDRVVVMSNGGFDNIHNKLLNRLKDQWNLRD